MLIDIKEKIKSLKNDSEEYNRAIDDVLELFYNSFKTCKIIHLKSGLYFNGYDDGTYGNSKGKNTLSKSNSKNFSVSNRSDNEILEMAFAGHMIIREGRKFIRNIIVYSGSDIHKYLSEHYEDYEYLPLSDFAIEK